MLQKSCFKSKWGWIVSLLILIFAALPAAYAQTGETVVSHSVISSGYKVLEQSWGHVDRNQWSPGACLPVDGLRVGFIYSSIVQPLHGLADLVVFARRDRGWRLLGISNHAGRLLEKLETSRTDTRPGDSHVCFLVIGRGPGATYLFGLYESPASSLRMVIQKK